MRFGLHGVAMALTDTPKIAVSGYAVGLQPRLRAWLSGEHAAAQRMAGMAFVIRVSGAVVIFLSQILLARWMGGVEFGIYVYAWTWLQMIAEVVHLGLPLSAQRIIPEYTERGQKDWLGGFLIGSRWTVFATATLAAMLGATAIYTLTPAIEHSTIMPLYLACIALPLYPVSNMLDGLARS